MIAVIGSHWLGRNESGGSRLTDEADPVRLVLEAALERKRRFLIKGIHPSYSCGRYRVSGTTERPSPVSISARPLFFMKMAPLLPGRRGQEACP